MNLFLYIQIIDHPEEVKFSNPILPFIKDKHLDFTIFDLDNHSDSLIISYAKRLLTEANQILIYIEANPDSNFSNLLSLMTYLLDNSEGVEIILKGNHPKLEKMLSVLTYSKIPETTYDFEKISKILSKFS